MKQIDFEEVIERILEKIDIVDVISRYVHLKRSGKNFLGLCPFHTEKTPSFSVSPEKQIFKCFGCGKGGNAIHFLQEYEGLSFREALEMLATEAGVDLSSYRRSATSGKKEEKTYLYELNKSTAQFFHRHLQKVPNKAFDYLQQRKITKEIIQLFMLGYAPDSWDELVQYLKKKGFQLQEAEKLGLVSLSSRQNYIDKFRDRLMFPIFDLNKNIVGFGGRVLDSKDETAKYINSPESLIYHKSKILFGLSHAKDAIRKEKFVIFVEGYFDFLRLFQGGIENVVATLGTAFTEEHARLIKRFTDKVYLCYDADKAGLNAILKAALLIINHQFEIYTILLPAGEDPDSFVARYGKEEFYNYLKEALSFQDFYIYYLQHQFELDKIGGQQKAREFVIQTLSEIEDEIVRNRLVQEASFVINISPRILVEAIQKNRQRGRKFKKKNEEHTVPASRENTIPIEEREILVLLLQNNPDVIGLILSQITFDDFKNKVAREIFVKICEMYDDLGEIKPSTVLASIHEDAVINELTKKLMEPYHNPIQYARDVIKKLKLKHLREQLEIITVKIKKMNDLASIDETILQKYNELLSQIKQLQNS